MSVGDIVKMKWLSVWDKYSCKQSKNDWHDRYKNHIGIVIAVYNKMWKTHANVEVVWLNIGKATCMTEDELAVIDLKS